MSKKTDSGTEPYNHFTSTSIDGETETVTLVPDLDELGAIVQMSALYGEAAGKDNRESAQLACAMLATLDKDPHTSGGVCNRLHAGWCITEIGTPAGLLPLHPAGHFNGA